MSFSTLGLGPELLKAVHAQGHTVPTPIQQQAIPLALDGGDLVGCAQTGTGKTGAFLLPTLTRLQQAVPSRRPAVRALVLCPTRELAVQVEAQAKLYGKFTNLKSVAIFGGVGMEPQVSALYRGVDLIVATPGRLLDHLNRGSVRLDQVEVLILDEADRMLDMGFAPDLKRILGYLPTERQTLLFSATVSREIAELSRLVLRSPRRVDIAPPTSTPSLVTQGAYDVADRTQKQALLRHLLTTGEEASGSVIVFTRTKRGTDKLQKILERDGVNAARIHGDRSQAQRTAALEQFKNGKTRILIATDIAARGIDVKDVAHVINYDVPMVPEDYIHRIGRTGRALATGSALTFIAPDERDDFRAIERTLGGRVDRVSVPDEVATVFGPPADSLPASMPARRGSHHTHRSTASAAPVHSSRPAPSRPAPSQPSSRSSESESGSRRPGVRPQRRGGRPRQSAD